MQSQLSWQPGALHIDIPMCKILIDAITPSQIKQRCGCTRRRRFGAIFDRCRVQETTILRGHIFSNNPAIHFDTLKGSSYKVQIFKRFHPSSLAWHIHYKLLQSIKSNHSAKLAAQPLKPWGSLAWSKLNYAARRRRVSSINGFLIPRFLFSFICVCL